MFDEKIGCPVAITYETFDGDFANENKLLKWCTDHMVDGDVLTLWAVQKNVLDNNDFISSLSRNASVEVVTSRGSSGLFQARGPVIAFYPHRDELSDFNNVRGMTALGVIAGSQPLNVWRAELEAEVVTVESANPEFEDGDEILPLSTVARNELESVSKILNHNNSLSSSFEKKRVRQTLESLRKAGELPDHRAAIEWAAAHGWRHDNPKQLGEWVKKYANGGSIRA